MARVKRNFAKKAYGADDTQHAPLRDPDCVYVHEVKEIPRAIYKCRAMYPLNVVLERFAAGVVGVSLGRSFRVDIL